MTFTMGTLPAGVLPTNGLLADREARGPELFDEVAAGFSQGRRTRGSWTELDLALQVRPRAGRRRTARRALASGTARAGSAAAPAAAGWPSGTQRQADGQCDARPTPTAMIRR